MNQLKLLNKYRHLFLLEFAANASEFPPLRYYITLIFRFVRKSIFLGKWLIILGFNLEQEIVIISIIHKKTHTVPIKNRP